VRQRLRCGIVNHNRGTIGASALLPFGGVAGSGNYRPAGATAIRNFIYPTATRVGRPRSRFPPVLAATPEQPRRHGLVCCDCTMRQ
jgi:hypothetical protein